MFVLDVNDNSPVCLPSSHLVSVAETAGKRLYSLTFNCIVGCAKREKL